MKTFLKENWFKVCIIIAILIIPFSVLWYFVINPYLNSKKLDKCLVNSKEEYRNRFKSSCVIDGREIGKDGFCLQSSERADKLGEYYKELKNDCFKKYPVK